MFTEPVTPNLKGTERQPRGSSPDHLTPRDPTPFASVLPFVEESFKGLWDRVHLELCELMISQRDRNQARHLQAQGASADSPGAVPAIQRPLEGFDRTALGPCPGFRIAESGDPRGVGVLAWQSFLRTTALQPAWQMALGCSEQNSQEGHHCTPQCLIRGLQVPSTLGDPKKVPFLFWILCSSSIKEIELKVHQL